MTRSWELLGVANVYNRMVGDDAILWISKTLSVLSREDVNADNKKWSLLFTKSLMMKFISQPV